jgi:maltoporin
MLPGGASKAFEFHGYLRSGVGLSEGDTDQVCFRTPGREGFSQKHRLGNECETYIETVFQHDFIPQRENSADPWARGRVTLSLETSGHRDFEPDTPALKTQNVPGDGISVSSKSELTIALREAFVESGNLLAPDWVLWIGKRFYRRKDIHLLDYYQLDTSGPGFGVENIGAGPGKLHLAYFRNIPNEQGPAQSTVDVRWSDVPIGIGNLETVVLYSRVGQRDSQTGTKAYEAIDGYSTQFFWSQNLGSTASNTFMLQYGWGLLGANGSWHSSLIDQRGAWGSQNIPKGEQELLDQREGSSTLRLIDHYVLDRYLDSWSMETILMYQNVDFNGELNSAGQAIPDKTETTIGLRPVWHVSDNVHLMTELGYSQVKNGIYNSDKADYETSELSKMTLASVFAPQKGYWFRPQFRFFATHAQWNDNSKGRVAANTVYENDNSGFTVGGQVEAWW